MSSCFFLFIFICSYPLPPHHVCVRQAGSRCWPEKDWHSEAGPLPAALTFLPDFDGAFEQRCVEGRVACLSSSGSPLLRVRCTVADCSTIAHAGTEAQTYTGTELRIHTYTHLYSNIHIYLYWWCYSHMKCTTTHAHTQSHSSCWDAFKDLHRAPGIKLARVERQKSRLLDGTWLSLPPLLFLLSTLPPSKTPMSL